MTAIGANADFSNMSVEWLRQELIKTKAREREFLSVPKPVLSDTERQLFMGAMDLALHCLTADPDSSTGQLARVLAGLCGVIAKREPELLPQMARFGGIL